MKEKSDAEKTRAIEEAFAEFNRICQDKDQAVALWQVLHTPELDEALERRRQWEILSLARR